MPKHIFKMSLRNAVTVVAGVLAVASAGAAQARQRVGWVLAYSPDATSAYTATGPYVYNSAGGAVAIVRHGTGSYEVKFARLYGGASSDVQVSVYGGLVGYCISNGWGNSKATLIAYVNCYDWRGDPADKEFTLLYQERSGNMGNAEKGIAFVRADNPTTASYTPSSAYSYNSTGGTNTIVRLGTGEYTVTVPGLTTNLGGVQVTAFGAVGRCKGQSSNQDSGGTNVNVFCFDKAGAPADEEFDLAYSERESFGHTLSASAKGAYGLADQTFAVRWYVMSTTHQYNGFATGRLKANRPSQGTYTVAIPGSLVYNFSNVLVTGWGGLSNYCNILSWANATIKVACYQQSGNVVNDDFYVAFQTAD